MRFLSMIRIDENRGQVPSEQLMNDMGKLIEEMTREGTLISTAGLRPTAEGARVRLRGGRLSTTDGPFTETREVIGGYAIIEAKSLKEAQSRWPIVSCGSTATNGTSSAKYARWTGRSSPTGRARVSRVDDAGSRPGTVPIFRRRAAALTAYKARRFLRR